MKKVLIITFLIYIIICPYYIFDSGLPQPADFVMAIGAFGFFFIVDKKFFLQSPLRNLLLFVILVVVVSLINQVDVTLGNNTGNTLMPIAFFTYNFLTFGLVIYLSGNMERQKLYNLVAWAIVISVGLQFGLAFLGIQKTGSNWTDKGFRSIIFFNNPNQLGYYILVIYTLFTVIPSKLRSYKLVVFGMLIMASYLVLFSLSRGAFIGVLLLNVIIFLKEGFKFKFTSLLFMIFIGLGSFLIVSNTDFVSNKLDSLQQRNEQKKSSIEREIKVRGYDRIFNNPIYLLYGAGEGGVDRFDTFNKKELHSGFGTLLFCYGIFGFVLFALFFYKVIQYSLFKNLLLLSPILLYNLSHHGLRNTLLWILLGFVFVVSYYNDDTNKKTVTN